MKVYLIRHGEPDYGPVTEAGYTGFGRDFSQLTVRGIEQAQACAQNPIFDEVQVMVSSPYTWALQTASEIIRYHDLPLQVELQLHEWQPDKSGTQLKSARQAMLAYAEYSKKHGSKNATSTWDYETSTEIKQRVTAVLAKYADYDCIACVTHSEVMRQFGGWQKIGYCEIKELLI